VDGTSRVVGQLAKVTIAGKQDQFVDDIGKTHAGTINLTDWTQKTAQDSIASGPPVDRGAVDFSESLGGPLADPDSNVWLAVLGAGKIMNGIFGRIYSKIGALPLRNFREEKPGASPLYVLAGFDDPAVDLKVSVWSPGAAPSWIDANQPETLNGVRELYVPISKGPQLVSFQADKKRTRWVLSHLRTARR